MANALCNRGHVWLITTVVVHATEPSFVAKANIATLHRRQVLESLLRIVVNHAQQVLAAEQCAADAIEATLHDIDLLLNACQVLMMRA